MWKEVEALYGDNTSFDVDTLEAELRAAHADDAADNQNQGAVATDAQPAASV